MDGRSAFFEKVREFHEANPPKPPTTMLDIIFRVALWLIAAAACVIIPGFWFLACLVMIYLIVQEWD